MAFLSLFSAKPLLNHSEQELVVNAIRASEKQTSGEIRVYVESRCKFVDPLDRAAAIFYSLKMDATELHNAVLVYVAVKDRQLAIFADEGIYQKAGASFWQNAVSAMLKDFNRNDYGQGIASVVKDIGDTLHLHFPYDAGTDKNELPDEIVFGK
jgi:uncharacterized membrane protein